MKFRTLPTFTADWARMNKEERAAFKAFVSDKFNPACDEYAATPTNYQWPKSLRFERIHNTKGVCAVTWSFSGPDGRATFQIDDVDGEPIIVWRRIGRHDIYNKP